MYEGLWDGWRRVTRFLESGRIALSREAALWKSLEIQKPDGVKLVGPGGNYEVKLGAHLEALEEAQTLHASVLLHTYALTESAAADHLGRDSRLLGKIEDWGAEMLKSNDDADWPEDSGGKVGLVEVAVVRNAYAHNNLRIDQAAMKRLTAAGEHTRTLGSSITLSYGDVVEFRHRLKMLLRRAGLEDHPRS